MAEKERKDEGREGLKKHKPGCQWDDWNPQYKK